MSKKSDPRLTPARPDLAAEFLRGTVQATQFVKGERAQVCVPVAGLFAKPDATSALQTEVFYGEEFTVYERGDTWAWGQAARDGFVGYVAAGALLGELDTPDHWVCALRTPLYREPDLKAPNQGYLHRNSLVRVRNTDDHYLDVGAGWVHVGDVRKLGDWSADFVDVALSYLHAPYVWGGRSSFGLDCSALVQNALLACGHAAPLRDSDMQEQSLGRAISFDADNPQLTRGDLVFWAGHVGIMCDGGHFLHANAHHMKTAIEPAKDAFARIQKTAGNITSVRRF